MQASREVVMVRVSHWRERPSQGSKELDHRQQSMCHWVMISERVVEA